jgi:hypothetical protein
VSSAVAGGLVEEELAQGAREALRLLHGEVVAVRDRDLGAAVAELRCCT